MVGRVSEYVGFIIMGGFIFCTRAHARTKALRRRFQLLTATAQFPLPVRTTSDFSKRAGSLSDVWRFIQYVGVKGNGSSRRSSSSAQPPPPVHVVEHFGHAHAVRQLRQPRRRRGGALEGVGLLCERMW